MNKTYFSFLGYCKARKLGYTPNQIKKLHAVGGDNWNITVFQSNNPQLTFVCCERDYFGWEQSWYSVPKNTWEFNPEVPVSDYANNFKRALA